MTHPTNDPMASDPPGYSEGPPEDPAEIDRARRHVDRLAHQNKPTGDSTGMRGPGDEDADRSHATHDEDAPVDRDA